jgi:hypothetical protein
MQPEPILHFMKSTIRQATSNFGDQVSWPDFAKTLRQILPLSMHEKLNLYLKCMAKQDFDGKEVEFSQQDIIQLCRASL